MLAYTSREAAQMLGVAPITLRKLSAVFAAWLTPAAAETAQVGEAWERFYTEEDLDVLRHGAALLRQKRDYAWARERMAHEFGIRDLERAIGESEEHADEEDLYEAEPQPAGARAQQSSHVAEVEVIDSEPHVAPDIAALLERMAALYQDMLRTKEQEIAALRHALDVTELAAANERRELEMVNRLAKIMERENQRLTTELEEARHQSGPASTARRGWFGRLFGSESEDTQSAPQTYSKEQMS